MGSPRRKLRRLLKLALFVSILIGLIRAALRRKKPEVTGEASWPPLADDTSAEPAQPDVAPEPAETDDTSAEPAQPDVAPEPAETGVTPEPVVAGAAAGTAWVEPVEGQCPASHPIKGNAQSKIFHVPGGASYDRTIAERCYASAEAAEADGFRAAKR